MEWELVLVCVWKGFCRENTDITGWGLGPWFPSGKYGSRLLFDR